MENASSRPPLAGLDEQLLAEHRHIREITDRLQEAVALPAVLEHLAELRTFLVGHFRNEEEAGGFFEAVRSATPHHLHRVDLLEREHGTILAELDALAARARACQAELDAVLEGGHVLGRRLRAHEEAEDHLLLDTTYTDLGEGG